MYSEPETGGWTDLWKGIKGRIHLHAVMNFLLQHHLHCAGFLSNLEAF